MLGVDIPGPSRHRHVEGVEKDAMARDKHRGLIVW